MCGDRMEDKVVRRDLDEERQSCLLVEIRASYGAAGNRRERLAGASCRFDVVSIKLSSQARKKRRDVHWE